VQAEVGPVLRLPCEAVDVERAVVGDRLRQREPGDVRPAGAVGEGKRGEEDQRGDEGVTGANAYLDDGERRGVGCGAVTAVGGRT
jgi:hypothetical protein